MGSLSLFNSTRAIANERTSRNVHDGSSVVVEAVNLWVSARAMSAAVERGVSVLTSVGFVGFLRSKT